MQHLSPGRYTDILLFSCMFFISLTSFSQQTDIDDFVFAGHVFSNDSLPIEGACIINCRSLKMAATDSTGYFRCRALPGDSLAIIHISYERIFVRPPKERANNCHYQLQFKAYEISPVVICDYKRDLANFEKNMKQIFFQMKSFGTPVDYRRNIAPKCQNAYAPGSGNPQYGRGIGRRSGNKIP